MRTQPQTIIAKLEADNSRLAKEAVIEEAMNEGLDEFFEGVKMALDPLVTFGVKQVPEKEENEVFWECYDDFVKFLKEKTNATVLQNPRAEADDLIARWIDKHPDQKHVILSTDKDLNQLVNERVKQYNGVTEQTITHEGWFDKKGNPVIDKKTKEAKGAPNIEWILFEKAMRGDPSDNIFSAYPGVRTKGTKNKIGLQEAFADRKEKGYTWNNLMLSRWVDHNGKERIVKNEYAVNQQLIDLTKQPQDIKDKIFDTIDTHKSEQKQVANVGIHLLKFCSKHDLVRIRDNVKFYAEPFNARFTQDQTITA